MSCDYCGRSVEGMPFRCRFCGGTFCAEHHLPPNHGCPGLALWASRPPPGVSMRYEGKAFSAVLTPEGREPRPAPAPPAPPAEEGRGEGVPVRVRVPVGGGRGGAGGGGLPRGLLLVLSSVVLTASLAGTLLSNSPLLASLFTSLFLASLVAALWLSLELRRAGTPFNRIRDAVLLSMLGAAASLAGFLLPGALPLAVLGALLVLLAMVEVEE